ncbi:hypothetical protein V3C99_012590 [Haemonchus contortus]|uniref:Presenilin n=2 Tax=Haemonchus contortus TaxID=6289 RepID=A0A7I4Y2X9_HAECO|nr:Peptidase A22A domain containing protein [Haemonchus contortus]
MSETSPEPGRASTSDTSDVHQRRHETVKTESATSDFMAARATAEGDPPEKEEAHATSEKESSSSSSSTLPSSKKRMYGSSDMVKVFIPVFICMLIVVLCVRNIEVYSDDHVIPAPYVIYREMDAEPTTRLWQSFINAGLLVGIIIVATCFIVCLFYLRCFYCLFGFVILATFSLLTVVSCIQYHKILEKIDMPVSLVLVFILHYNFVVLAMMAIFWKGPLRVQQTTLIVVSAVITLTLMELLPKWTTWTLLIIIAVWDLIAVLTPCGPLKILVDIAEKRGDDLMPVLIYSGSVFLSQVTEGQKQNENGKSCLPNHEPTNRPSPAAALKSLNMRNSISTSEEESRSIRLGLGDFIFYSLLVGTATATSDWATTLACCVSILTGLGFTLVLLVILQQALPALPISIVFGVVAYFGSKLAMSSMILEFNRKLILV